LTAGLVIGQSGQRQLPGWRNVDQKEGDQSQQQVQGKAGG